MNKNNVACIFCRFLFTFYTLGAKSHKTQLSKLVGGVEKGNRKEACVVQKCLEIIIHAMPRGMDELVLLNLFSSCTKILNSNGNTMMGA